MKDRREFSVGASNGTSTTFVPKLLDSSLILGTSGKARGGGESWHP